MKKILFRLSSLLLIVLLSFCISSCSEKDIETKDNEVFEIHTELQMKFLQNNYDLVSLCAKGKEELSKPNPVTIKWRDGGVGEYLFKLSEDREFKDAREIKVNTNQVSIYNLKINTKYYWCVEYMKEDILTKTDTKTFTVAGATPRNLDIDGITNARDLGGYSIGLDSYVKQGMIYRCSRFNENKTTTNLITEKGIKEMREVLNIKSELDVREKDESGNLTSSPLGNDINYYLVPMESGGNIILLNKDIIKDVFAVLGNEDNYPIVIHCSIGTDRTGMICFLINALLGVSEENLYRDYLFSNFGNIGKSRDSGIITTYIETVDVAEGDTLALKTYNYLLSIGVSKTDLDTLIKVMK